MRQARRAVGSEECRRAARRLRRIAASSNIIRGARNVALYTSNDGEIDTTDLAALLRGYGATCHVPVIVGRRGQRHLAFAPLEARTPVRPNRYGIPEPVVSAREFRQASQLDLIFMPLVAYDADGNRLGMGGGYYDRTLAWKQRRRHWSGTRLIGVAWQFQRLDRLPVESWDIGLDGILTDTHYRAL